LFERPGLPEGLAGPGRNDEKPLPPLWDDKRGLKR
jgi:hypothetical protein